MRMNSALAPSGQALPWAGTLTTVTIKNETVLAATMQTGIGWGELPAGIPTARTRR